MPPLNVVTDESQFPNLLFISDVPVEASYHGSALVFRLLQNWPSHKLRVIESNLLSSHFARRLPNVQYDVLRIGMPRLLSTRFARWYSAWLSKRASQQIASVESLLADFKPQAIVTVTHGYLWLTAAAYAKAHNIPLHLICHDDWPRVGYLPSFFVGWLDSQFREVYQFATSRMCVSPAMCEAYRERYGAGGVVVYPSRASDAPDFAAPPARLAEQSSPFTVAFAGTINTTGYVEALLSVAQALATINGRLMIFGPLTHDEAQRNGLARENIVLAGLVPSANLMQRLRAEADVLFVPMSFAAADRPNMEISFPSKLTDYTAVGLPLLIYGPPYCSAVRWANIHPHVAKVIDVSDESMLAEAVEQLASDPELRLKLGQSALEIGNDYFSFERGQQEFYKEVSLKK